MASLIPGYEYDIFISYRQKDNKGDRWVSEFVEALRTELEATFKDEISIYFDENPHDRLQETYNVDKSLEGKLKSLLLIPILSQTYCDPNSYAWQHEFLAFNKMAADDQFGKDIRLRNGNVASRMLPIRIHDLDAEDVKLFEEETGSVLRAVDFVFKTSSGVNRPLRVSEDHPNDNLSKTFYRDQLNKVAHAIKEIISGMKAGQVASAVEKIPRKKTLVKVTKEEQKKLINYKNIFNQKTKKWIIIFFSVILFAFGLLVIISKLTSINKQTRTLGKTDKTIAVLPFRNLSNDTTQLYFCDGIMEEILNNLQLIKSFTVRSRTSSALYRNTPKSIVTIGHELNANYLVEGSVGREGNILKIWVQLIDSKVDKHVWSTEYTREMKQIFSLQNEIANEIAAKLETILSPEEIDKIQIKPTENLEAYDLYLLGMHYFNNYAHDIDFWKANEYFQHAVDIDSKFALAYEGLAEVYYSLINFGLVDPREAYLKVKSNTMKALELNKELANAHCLMGKVKLNFYYDLAGAEKEYKRALEINQNSSRAHGFYADYLSLTGRHDEAISHANNSVELDPVSRIVKFRKMRILFDAGYTEDALKLAEKARDSDPDWFNWYWNCALFYTGLGKYQEAVAMVQKQINLMGNDNISDEIGLLGYLYGKLGQNDKALKQLDLLDEMASRGLYISQRTKFRIYMGLGNFDKAMEILENALDDHSMELVGLKLSHDYDPLRKNPRFIELLKKTGF